VALIRSATDVILQRFQEPLTLESVAAELHVSPQHLSTLFSRFAGMSFIEYLTDRRLAFAVGAMQNGANVTEACFLSGYRNLSHFIRSFKKKYGATPAKFMRQNG
jgi:AraC-like DNA-binding protein